MKPFSNMVKRVLLASGLALLTACGSNGVTDPTAARKSGYLTVSASVAATKPTTTTTTTTTVKTSTTVSAPGTTVTTSSGYNVPAN